MFNEDQIPVMTNWEFINYFRGRRYIPLPTDIVFKERRVILTDEEYEDYLFYRETYDTCFTDKLTNEAELTAIFGNPPTSQHWYFGLSPERRSNMPYVYIAIYENN